MWGLYSFQHFLIWGTLHSKATFPKQNPFLGQIQGAFLGAKPAGWGLPLLTVLFRDLHPKKPQALQFLKRFIWDFSLAVNSLRVHCQEERF